MSAKQKFNGYLFSLYGRFDYHRMYDFVVQYGSIGCYHGTGTSPDALGMDDYLWVHTHNARCGSKTCTRGGRVIPRADLTCNVCGDTGYMFERLCVGGTGICARCETYFTHHIEYNPTELLPDERSAIGSDSKP